MKLMTLPAVKKIKISPIFRHIPKVRYTRTRAFLTFTVLVIVALLIGGRLYLPIWLEKYVNQQISALENYGGSVGDIDVHLWRGAYQIQGLEIYKKNGGLKEPFIEADKIELSVNWRALLNGVIVSEIDVYRTNLVFAKSQTGEDKGWFDLVDSLSPFEINRLEVHSGKIAYKDYQADPNINLYISDINALVTNLRNIRRTGDMLPSTVQITGNSIGHGHMKLDGRMNVLKEIPDFDMSFSIENAQLSAFNDYSRSLAAIDFESGTIGVYSELAAADGYITGYVKPVATDISVVSIENDSNPFNALWEIVASVFIQVFKNQPQDQFALRIPIKGNLKDPERDMFRAFISIFSNAFGHAFSKSEDGTIDFEDAMKRQ